MRDLARAFREVLFFLILSFIASTSIAKRGFCNQQAGILTLEGAIEEGLSRAPQIHNARAVVEETSWKKAEFLSAGFLPKLSVSGTQYLSIQYSVTTLTGLGSSPTNFLGFFPTTTLGLDLNIPVFDGLANVRNLQGASLAEEAAKKELARAEFQLRKEIQLSYFQALAASQLDEVSVENVKTMEDHLRQVTLQNQGGSATKVDVLRVSVQLSDARADEIDAKDNVLLTRKKLTQLIGLEADLRGLEGNLPIPDHSKVKDLVFKEIAENRDDIQALNLRAEAAGKFRCAQKAWMSPSIFLNGQALLYDQQQVNFATSAVTNTGVYQTAYNVSVSLKWNLFDGGVSLARANQAVFREIEALKVAETAHVAVPYDFDYWKRRYISNSDHYIAKKLDIDRSEESVRLAKEEERAGSRTITETLDAELDLFRAKAGAVTAQLNAAEAQIKLELVLGRSL